MARPEVGILQKQSKKRQKRSKLGNKWLHFGELGLYVGEADVKRYRLSMSEPLLAEPRPFRVTKEYVSFLFCQMATLLRVSHHGRTLWLMINVSDVQSIILMESQKKMLRTVQSQTNAVYGNLLLLSMQ
ncbi:hypothetical protein CDAR_108341 [Caerostris darwini]|uniref:Uncharacterized protein n=1 Tax=Caerostris darwini TaxID=1538125 RepID=A0AAV4PTU2_9ARAC|nr:hypothetical protein CDAR_108341 [Caerostris darwini]